MEKYHDTPYHQATRILHNAQPDELLDQHSAAMKVSLDGIAVLDNDRFIYVNPSHAEMFGYSIDEMLGQSWHLLYSPDQIAEFQELAFTTLTRSGHWRGEMIATRKDGSTFDQEVALSLLANGQLICICRDITDRKQTEQQFNQTNQRLEVTNAELIRATRLKDEFLANMSHELRTPLNAILGMAEALREETFGSLNERQIKSLRTIERSGQHLLSLINDILDVSKIEAGKLELDTTNTTVLRLCNSSLALIKQQALNKQIHLDIQIPPTAGNIIVDERRMRQVLINLLSNAVKFTPEGGRITLGVTRFDSDDDTLDYENGRIEYGRIEFAVTDTGIGIASTDRDKLFQPFIQLDSSLNRQYQGTGLGLTLVKQIVELHGGSISLQSEVGQGSCFTVSLPHTCLVPNVDNVVRNEFDSISYDYYQTFAEIAEPSLILLAEDNEANIDTFASYLTAKGYRTVLAENGLEAIELAESKQPDLILMDIQMPKMDGLEAIALIRQNPKLAKIPIVALTALAMEGDRERCLAAGANDYLTKPVQLKQLNLKIQEWLDWN